MFTYGDKSYQVEVEAITSREKLLHVSDEDGSKGATNLRRKITGSFELKIQQVTCGPYIQFSTEECRIPYEVLCLGTVLLEKDMAGSSRARLRRLRSVEM